MTPTEVRQDTVTFSSPLGTTPIEFTVGDGRRAMSANFDLGGPEPYLFTRRP